LVVYVIYINHARLSKYQITYLLIKYIQSVVWRVAKSLSYIEDARWLQVKLEAAIKPVMKTEDVAYVTLVRCIYTIPSLYAKHIDNKDTK